MWLKLTSWNKKRFWNQTAKVCLRKIVRSQQTQTIWQESKLLQVPRKSRSGKVNDEKLVQVWDFPPFF